MLTIILTLIKCTLAIIYSGTIALSGLIKMMFSY